MYKCGGDETLCRMPGQSHENVAIQIEMKSLLIFLSAASSVALWFVPYHASFYDSTALLMCAQGQLSGKPSYDALELFLQGLCKLRFYLFRLRPHDPVSKHS